MADSGGVIAGSVFLDANGDGMVSLNEATVANAMVFVQPESGDQSPYLTVTDGQGYFLTSNLPYGRYVVWADGGTQTKQLVEIGEVNAAVQLDLPVYDNSDDVELLAVRSVFLPVVIR